MREREREREIEREKEREREIVGGREADSERCSDTIKMILKVASYEEEWKPSLSHM